jgi:predicted transcriptional regulator
MLLTRPMKQPDRKLSRRERQIMDIVYRHERATANDVRASLPDPPSYSAVRALLRILEEKGHLRHEQDGPRYVFLPTVPRETASRNALEHLVNTFFEDSTEQAVAALLELRAEPLTQTEIDRLEAMIDQARKEGR